MIANASRIILVSQDLTVSCPEPDLSVMTQYRSALQAFPECPLHVRFWVPQEGTSHSTRGEGGRDTSHVIKFTCFEGLIQ